MKMNWEEIVGGGLEDLTSLVEGNAEVIANLYEKGERKDAIDINLKFRIEPVKNKEDDVKVKTGISLTTDRIKENKDRTVSPQQELPDSQE